MDRIWGKPVWVRPRTDRILCCFSDHKLRLILPIFFIILRPIEHNAEILFEKSRKSADRKLCGLFSFIRPLQIINCSNNLFFYLFI